MTQNSNNKKILVYFYTLFAQNDFTFKCLYLKRDDVNNVRT